MGNKIRVIVALVIIVGVAIWAINGVRLRSYSGANLSFKVGGGHVVATNPGDEPIPVEMRAEGRSANFRVQSTELGLSETSKRQTSGRDVYHSVVFELPPGQAKIDVTRGSGVQFISSSNQRIDAVVARKEAGGVRFTLIFAGVVILAALYYISHTFEHRWIGTLRSKLAQRLQRSERTAA